MSPMRLLIVAFWIFIGGVLVWQAYTYEINSEKIQDAKPQHFFFDPSKDNKPAAADPNLHVADVRQTGYSITNDPVTKNIFCHVVLMNKGNTKAVGIQVFIKPYYRATVDQSRNAGGKLPYPLSDSDPRAQLGQSFGAADLAPGESCTVTATFMSQPGLIPSTALHPQITFETEKANP